MFYLLRYILWGIGIFVLIFLYVKRHAIKKVSFFLCIILYTAFISIITVFPIENLFYNFDSPQAVFEFAEQGTLDDVVYGENSALFVYSKGNSRCSTSITTKSENGYKIPKYYSFEKIFYSFDKVAMITVIKAKNTEDYYLYAGVNTQENVPPVIENNGEEIHVMQLSPNLYFICFNIKHYAPTYSIVINGEKIVLSGS